MALSSSTVSATNCADVSNLDLINFRISVPAKLTTEAVADRSPNYKSSGEMPKATEIGGEIKVQPLLKGEERVPRATAAPAAGQTFKGVVEQIDVPSSHVTLFYGGRENIFLFPTDLLTEAGADYVGALFEIVMKLDDNFHSYDIVHLKEEEDRARREIPVGDLTFLDDLAPPPFRKRK